MKKTRVFFLILSLVVIICILLSAGCIRVIKRDNTPEPTLTPEPTPEPEPTPTPEPEPAPPPVERWVVAPVAAGTRPAYEPVRNLAGDAWVRGGEQGRVAVGAECGDEVFRVGSNSYRYVTAVELSSPTYSGRDNVAVCARP